MSVFVEAALLTLLVVFVGVAAISGFVLIQSLNEEDTASAWVWVVVFTVASFGAAWSFWRFI